PRRGLRSERRAGPALARPLAADAWRLHAHLHRSVVPPGDGKVRGAADDGDADRVHRAGRIESDRYEDRREDSGSAREGARRRAALTRNAEPAERRVLKTFLRAFVPAGVREFGVLADRPTVRYHTNRNPIRPVLGARIAVGCWNALPVLKLIVSAAYAFSRLKPSRNARSFMPWPRLTDFSTR